MSKKETLISRGSPPVPRIVLFFLLVFFVGLMGYLSQQGLDEPVAKSSLFEVSSKQTVSGQSAL